MVFIFFFCSGYRDSCKCTQSAKWSFREVQLTNSGNQTADKYVVHESPRGDWCRRSETCTLANGLSELLVADAFIRK